jgi:hypothetical protein
VEEERIDENGSAPIHRYNRLVGVVPRVMRAGRSKFELGTCPFTAPFQRARSPEAAHRAVPSTRVLGGLVLASSDSRVDGC